jgi:hypothetical protein
VEYAQRRRSEEANMEADRRRARVAFRDHYARRHPRIECSESSLSVLPGRARPRSRVPSQRDFKRPLVELDALHHGAGWVTRPTFVDDVDAATRGSAWVVDGNYAAVRELLWSRADTVVWLDLPRWVAGRSPFPRAMGESHRAVERQPRT